MKKDFEKPVLEVVEVGEDVIRTSPIGTGSGDGGFEGKEEGFW